MIRLYPHTSRPGGPDGKGWNRLSLNAHMGPGAVQCALRPRDYPQLYAATRDTRLSAWGGHADCVRPELPCDGGCPILARLSQPRRELRSFTQSILARIEEVDPGWLGPILRVWLMNRPEGGWSERGNRWAWDDLALLEGWEVGRRHVDEHGDGFWLNAIWPSINGVYGSAPATQDGDRREPSH